MSPMISTILLLAGLILAPIIGGGLGELARGVLQILIAAAVASRVLSRGAKDASWSRTPRWWFLLAFAGLAVISAAFSRAIYFSLSHLLFLSACIGAFILCATLCRDKRIAAAAVWAVVLSALFVSGVAVRGYILNAGGGIGFWRELTSSGDHARLFGPFVNPNFFAGYLVIVMPVTLALFLTTRRALVAVLPAAAFAFELMALMLTGAKFGVVAAAAALALFLLLNAVARTLDGFRLRRLLIIAAVAIPLLVPFSMPVKSRVEQAQVGGAQVHSTAFRIYTWKATLNMIAAQPVFGVGPGVYGITYPQYTIAGPTKFAHNSYLHIAAEMGIPALIALVLFLLTIAWRSLGWIRSRPADDVAPEAASESITWADFVPSDGWRIIGCGIFAALVGSSIRSLVDSDWYVTGIALPFWGLAGVLCALAHTESSTTAPGKIMRPVLLAMCGVVIVLSGCFGIGYHWASRAAEESREGRSASVVDLYARAAAVSPLNPEYHRQLGIWLGLGQGEFERAREEIGRSINLARNTSEGGWKAKGMLAIAERDWQTAVSSLETALKFNPNSTDTLNLFASAHLGAGDVDGYEATLRRLLEVEKSPYERIKGTPELIDTTYASAHAYFGNKAMQRKDYESAVVEFETAVDRLERWRKSGAMREIQELMGMSNEAEDQRRLDLLRECYKGLVDAYYALGREADVDEALDKLRKVD